MLSDEAVIATWMEPKPTEPHSAFQESPGGWWLSRLHVRMHKLEWFVAEKASTLDALWEVESRLKRWCLEDVTRTQFWDEYDAALYSAMRNDGADDPLWHATASQKIAALASVLRSEVEK